MSSKVDIQRNKLTHLGNTLVMYGVYNTEKLERLIKAVHTLHSRQCIHEKLFARQITKAYEYYSQRHGDCGMQHYAINSMLYLRMIKDKHIELCNEFICYTTKTERSFGISKGNTEYKKTQTMT